MTEAEVIELVGIHAANAITAFTVFVSFTFGFLAAAYFVGPNLTSAQAIIATLLYSVSAGAAIATHALFHQIIFATLGSASSSIDSLFLLTNEAIWVWGMVSVQLTGMAASIYFMWSVRHPKSE